MVDSVSQKRAHRGTSRGEGSNRCGRRPKAGWAFPTAGEMLRRPVIVAIAVTMLVLNIDSEPRAQGAVSFKGKTITMIVGSAAGGGTDATGRLIAPFLRKYLPGEPNIVIQNMPGANGITSVNYFVHRTQPDGLTVMMNSNSQIDPLVYRSSGALYDPKSLRIVGGIGRGGTIIFVSAKTEPHLYNKSEPPVVIGSIDVNPRAAMQPALWCIEYLGWNAKWVIGYRGTNEVMLAFDRREIDLTSTGNIFEIRDRLRNGELKILNQSGALENGKLVTRKDFDNAPLFTDQMRGKVTDPIAQKALDYWVALSNADKWVALAPNSADAIVEAYREAFRRLSTDKELLDLSEKISDGFTPIMAHDFESVVRTLADTPPEALDYIKGLMRKQGLRVK
jgi:hypothetical protein